MKPKQLCGLILCNDRHFAQIRLVLQYEESHSPKLDGCCELLTKSARTIAYNMAPYDSSAHKRSHNSSYRVSITACKQPLHWSGRVYRKCQGTGGKVADPELVKRNPQPYYYIFYMSLYIYIYI